MRLALFFISLTGICIKGSCQLLTLAKLDSANQYYTMSSARENKDEVYWFAYLGSATKDTLNEEITTFPNLNRLSIWNGHYKSIPSSIGQLKYLQELMIYECPDLNIQELFNNLEGLQHLRYLDLSYFNSTAYEGANKINLNGISKLKNLEFLSIMYDHLDSFPIELYELKKLKTLILSSTGLNSLPEDIGNLTSLEELYLGTAKEGEENAITKLPESFSKLVNLRLLNLDGCNIDFTSTLEILKKLPKLEDLDVSMINIETLPASISELKSLKNVSFYNCGIKNVPESISQLKQLETISFTYCPIDEQTKADLKKWLPNTKIYY